MKLIEALLQAARKRWLWNLALEQSALAAAVALGGLILLLVVGTQVLDWFWLALLFVGTLGFGAYRIAHRVPTPYTIAQVVDRRMESHDAISTAWYYAQPEREGSAPEDIRNTQRESAERLASAADVRAIIPFVMPRTAYAVTVLIFAAGSIMGIRYGIRRSLDLRPPIAQAVFDFFSPFSRSQQAKNKPPEDQRLQQLIQESSIPLNDETGQLRAGDQQDPAMAQMEEGKASDPEFKKVNAKTSEQNNDPESSDEAGERATPGQKNANGQPPDGSPQGQNQQQGKGKQAPKNPEESSMLQKMREAMANLLDKLKIQPPQQSGSEKSEQASNKGLPSGQSQKNENGKPMPGKPQSGGQDAQADSQQQGEGNERAEGGKNSKGERGNDERAAQEGKSGVGSQDGDKALRDAANQAAMGKISEILGKRAQNITGEMMVEVSSGKQQPLRTQYSNQRAGHSESGGEIHRDEVPLMYQQYVQQYFEEIRKPEAAGKSKQATGAKQ